MARIARTTFTARIAQSWREASGAMRSRLVQDFRCAPTGGSDQSELRGVTAGLADGDPEHALPATPEGNGSQVAGTDLRPNERRAHADHLGELSSAQGLIVPVAEVAQSSVSSTVNGFHSAAQ